MDDARPAPDAEPTFPHPPRYWWLKRVSLGLLLLALALGVAWREWAREAGRRLRARTDVIAAAGDPVVVADLVVPPVPDAENGALLYLEAGRVLKSAPTIESPSSSSMSYADYPPYPPRWHRMASQSYEGNQPVLALMRRARDYKRFDWRRTLRAPPTDLSLSYIHPVHHMANLGGDAALYAHFNGDDAAALEYVRDVLHSARAIDAPPTVAMQHMTSVYSIESNVLYRLELIAQALTVAPDEADKPGRSDEATPVKVPERRPAKRPATRAQVRALIGELLDDADRHAALRRSFASERALQAETGAAFGRGLPLLRPMFDLDTARVVDGGNALVRAAAADDFQSARAVLRTDPALTVVPPQTNLMGPPRAGAAAAVPPRRKPVDYSRLLSTDVGPGFAQGLDRAIDYHMRTRTERRLAATSLAVQLYRADNGGRAPPTLQALVPEYLPAIPVDPLAGDRRPIAYVVVPRGLPGGGDRPLVYSVGADGGDDTVARGTAAVGTVPYFGWQSTTDQWRDVVRWMPPATTDPKQEATEEQEWAEREAKQKKSQQATTRPG